MVNYSEGRIFQIWFLSDDTLGPYFGCTTQPLCKIFSNLKRQYDETPAEEKPNFIYGDIRRLDARIDLVELFPCETRAELAARVIYHEKTFRGEVVEVVAPEVANLLKKERIWETYRIRMEAGKRKVECAFCKCSIAHNSLHMHEKTAKHEANRAKVLAEADSKLPILPQILAGLHIE